MSVTAEPPDPVPEPPDPVPEPTRPAGDGAGSGDPSDADGIYLYGVVRAGSGWQVLRRRDDPRDELGRIRFRDLEAVVRDVPLALPPMAEDAVAAHHRVVDLTMRGETILPAPFGVIFRERREVLRFMEEEYAALREALSLVEGHLELRMHIAVPPGANATDQQVERAARIYSELRRLSHSALPFPPEGDSIFSAAFLVPRERWIEFWEGAEALVLEERGLTLDLTGPWPPYDFVRLTF